MSIISMGFEKSDTCVEVQELVLGNASFWNQANSVESIRLYGSKACK